MITLSLRTASLALAGGGLALSVPASALPSAPSAQSASAFGAIASYDDVGNEANYDRRDRGGHGGWKKQDHGGRYDRRYGRYQSNYPPRAYYNSYPANYGEPVHNNTRVWQGDDGRYYCRRSNGTTGLLIGGAAGALLGREIAGRGDRTLGTVLGAAGGALLGRSIDSKTRCR